MKYTAILIFFWLLFAHIQFFPRFYSELLCFYVWGVSHVSSLWVDFPIQGDNLLPLGGVYECLFTTFWLCCFPKSIVPSL